MNGSGSTELAISRRNIISIACIVIKALCQAAGETVLDEIYHAVNDLITILENIFYHGLKRRGNFQFRGSAHPWDFVSHVCERVCPGCVEKVELISRCQSDYSKLRTWIKIALMEHRLHDVFPVLRAEIPKLEKLYNKEAVLLSSELDEVVDAMYQLKSLEFSLNVKQNHGNDDGFKPIDYTPYLSGDACRFQLFGRSSEKHYSKEHVDQDSHWRLRLIEQQKICDFLRDQQRCTQDKLKLKEIELQHCMAELAEYKSFRRDMEDTVLHLQQQIEQKPPITRCSTDRPSTVQNLFDFGRWRSQVNLVDRQSQFTPPGSSVDQGIDALTYYLSTPEDTIATNPCAHPRPRSLYVPPTYTAFVEVGEEPELESQTTEPVFSHSVASVCNPHDRLARSCDSRLRLSEQNQSLETLCQRPPSQTVRTRRRHWPVHSKSAVRLGMQKLPELHEQFVLLEIPSPQNFSTALLVNEIQDPIGGAKLPFLRSIYRPIVRLNNRQRPESLWRISVTWPSAC
ncbi:hypothetical protein CRM22_008354 [Opisthorchis felineus]|uniref:RUN domain-containing protein n=1 Tax=Opisthorchis felineus TaxID=147828 RepID=A0A4S2LDM2_OPIFE|nr:hypothetical protein CRM22_008354 [Opisthorchis felineus]